MSFKVIKKIRKQIPSFDCIPGCTDCCGPVPFSQTEWDRIDNKLKGESLNCPYSLNGSCDIYDDRPIICRLFGTVDKLKCPHGCKPKSMLNRHQENKIMDLYQKVK